MKRLLIIFLLVFCSFNIVYGAECDTSTYNINYYVNGGEKINNVSTNYLSEIESLQLPVPVKGNDAFVGWYFLDGTKIDIEDVLDKFKNSKTCDTTVNLYAKYKSVCEKSDTFLTVSFNTDGGSEMIDLEVTKEPLKDLVPKKEGYTFLGWYYGNRKINWDKKELISLVDTTIASNGCINPKHIVLNAKWAPEGEQATIECVNNVDYVIDFVTNASTGLKSYYSTDTYYDVLPVLTRDNYNFIGWYTDKEFNNPVSDNKISAVGALAEKTKGKDGCDQPGHVTLYAKWEKIDKCMSGGYAMYVRYQTNGGREEKDDFIVVNSNIIKKLPIPEKEGYVFAGWYYDKELTDRVTTNILPKLKKDKKTDANGCAMYSDINLYAKWINKSVFASLTYYLNFQVNGAEAIKTMEVPVKSESSTLLPVPVRDGYVFGGWYYDGKFEKMVTTNKVVEVAKDYVLDENDNPVFVNNMTLYAKWLPIEDVSKENDDEDLINYFADGNYVIQITNEKDSSIINIIVEHILDNAEIENLFKNVLSFQVMYSTYVYGSGAEDIPIDATISFDIPKNIDYSKLAVYGLHNGKKVNYKYTLKDDTVSITTNNLGIFVLGEKVDRSFDIVIAGLCTLLVIFLIIYAKKCNFKIGEPIKEKLDDSNKNIIPPEEPVEAESKKEELPVTNNLPVSEENNSTLEANIDNYLIDKETKTEEVKEEAVVEENEYSELASEIVEITDEGENQEEVRRKAEEEIHNTVEIDIPDFEEFTNNDK